MIHLVRMIAIGVLVFLCGGIVPWWGMILLALLVQVVFVNRTTGWAFLEGFLGVGLCWLLVSLYKYGMSDGLLTKRMAGLFHLPSPLLLLFVTVVIGGLMGGLGGATGYSLRQGFLKMWERYR